MALAMAISMRLGTKRRQSGGGGAPSTYQHLLLTMMWLV
jgi:hypothetical protein